MAGAGKSRTNNTQELAVHVSPHQRANSVTNTIIFDSNTRLNAMKRFCLCSLLLLLLLLFPHISPISRTRGHRRRLPFPYHRYIQKTQTKEEKERKKITDEKTSPDLIGGEGKK